MSQADDIQRILNNWSRNGQISLPAAETIQLPKKEGGWNLVNVKSALLARKTMVAHKLLFSDQPWARHKRQLISKHQKNLLKIQKNYKKKDWPSPARDHVKTWFLARRPQKEQANTSNITTYFKKNTYLRKKWPTEPDDIWQKLCCLDLPPQIHVNAWRWLRGALPLKERVYWSSSIDSLLCRWCPSSPQMHHHFLHECILTKKIIKEIENKMGPRIFEDAVLDRNNWYDNKMSFWLSSWLINYTWNSAARINLDVSVREESLVLAAPHVFKLDVLAYYNTSMYKNHLKKVKEGLRAFLR